jgi:hypothetical protein
LKILHDDDDHGVLDVIIKEHVLQVRFIEHKSLYRPHR